MAAHTFQVTGEQVGQRLDVVLAAELDVSRSTAHKFIKAEQVLINGAPGKASVLLNEGDQVEVDVPIREKVEVDVPELKVLYEDDDLMVIDKPADLAVHLSETGRPQPTVAGFAAAKGVQDEDTDRPGIVHRLDKDTSGAMVVAKNTGAKEYLQKLFASREIHKSYVALVTGRLSDDEATIRLPISRSRTQPVKRAVVPGGRMSVTHYKVLEVLPGASLVEVSLETGRTHQIRVHFSHLGHPVVGDSLYGSGKSPLPKLSRQFLHAQRLSFKGPSGQKVDVISPLPSDLSEYLENLRRNI